MLGQMSTPAHRTPCRASCIIQNPCPSCMGHAAVHYAPGGVTVPAGINATMRARWVVNVGG